MPITEFLPLRTRKQVAWFRDEPPAAGALAFTEQDFVVTTCTGDDLQREEFLAGLAAVVFTQSATKLFQIRQDLRDHASTLLDYDCRVIVRPAAVVDPDPKILPISIVAKAVDDFRLPTGGVSGSVPRLPHVYIFDVVPWKAVANYVVQHPPGKAPAPSGEINVAVKDKHGREAKLSAGADRLIRRAFADCAEVHLEEMQDEGHSGAAVYCAYTELRAGHPGQWPVPCFVKVDNRTDILTEYENYVRYVDPYIPFHLGPHLIRDRCCLGAREGVIVGDFVAESESLLHCAGDGRAASAIACLFDRTLYGWHRVATLDSKPISEILRAKFPRKIIPESRRKRAQELGATLQLAELRELFDRCTSTPVMVGLIHGDLHAKNVRVRAGDAIVIDFYGHRSDPLVYDAASLEASLVVEGFAENMRRDESQPWLQSIRMLYNRAPLDNPPPHVNPKSPSAWFHACVRQIRLYARRMECGSHQYAAALAVALLVKASKDPDVAEPEASRRAAAYVLAQDVLLSTFDAKLEASR